MNAQYLVNFLQHEEPVGMNHFPEEVPRKTLQFFVAEATAFKQFGYALTAGSNCRL